MFTFPNEILCKRDGADLQSKVLFQRIEKIILLVIQVMYIGDVRRCLAETG